MRSRAGIAAVAAISLACGLLGPAALALAEREPPAPPQIDILSPEKVEVSADQEESVDVLVRNSGGSPLVVGFEVEGEYAPKVFPASAEVFGYSVRWVTLYFTPAKAGEEVSGELIASGKGTAPAGIAFTSSAGQTTPWWIYAILFASLGAALALVAIRWLVGEYPRKATLAGRIGPANWDFTKSWGSTLAAVGALLGTIVAAGVLPDTSSVPKTTYAGLNFFFGALILIAPFIYTATQTAAPVDRAKPLPEPQFQGYVWSFLLATAITLWAVLGEFGTILAVFNEVRVGQTMPQVTIWILGAVLTLSAGLLLAMSWRRIKAIVEFQASPESVGLVEADLPSWPLL
jgi:VIT1/CCC1 family predicted Fe2+/Mn2+ transporter